MKHVIHFVGDPVAPCSLDRISIGLFKFGCVSVLDQVEHMQLIWIGAPEAFTFREASARARGRRISPCKRYNRVVTRKRTLFTLWLKCWKRSVLPIKRLGFRNSLGYCRNPKESLGTQI